ncbi:MAG TPA: ribokinase [Acidobacteriaceae bacterium]|nr:ribokinase [Acidobacteriaceae bacterium]
MSFQPIVIMGVFAMDLAFRTPVMPAWGETLRGTDFRMGPGGKGSNQAVAAARLGGDVYFISKVGSDNFGALARQTHRSEGVHADFLFEFSGNSTGAALIVVDEARGENAIIVVPGAADQLSVQEIDMAEDRISSAACFMTQLELPLPLVEHGLKVARRHGVPTILNPAPGCALPDTILKMCDYLTPNESEATALTGLPVQTWEQAERAAEVLLARGVRNVVITLGDRGALVKSATLTARVDAFQAGKVLETTGAGDALNAGFAIGLAEGMDVVRAVRFGCATAGISVTRPGTAPSMPRRSEVDALLAEGHFG